MEVVPHVEKKNGCPVCHQEPAFSSLPPFPTPSTTHRKSPMPRSRASPRRSRRASKKSKRSKPKRVQPPRKGASKNRPPATRGRHKDAFPNYYYVPKSSAPSNALRQVPFDSRIGGYFRGYRGDSSDDEGDN